MAENNKYGNQEKQVNQGMDTILREVFQAELPESEVIDARMTEAYAQIVEGAETIGKTEKTKKRGYHYAGRVAVAAGLVLALGLSIGAANPALAAEIPVIGKIFAYLEEQISYKGDYSEHAVPVEDLTERLEKTDSQFVQDGTYTQTDGELTVGITEVSRDGDKLYLAMRISCEEGFPQDFIEEEVLGASVFSCISNATLTGTDGTQAVFSQETGNMPCWKIEGQFQDQNTFVGIAMLEVAGLDSAETVEVNFTQFFKELRSTHLENAHVAGEEESSMLPVNNQKIYEGNWTFRVTVENLDTTTEVKVAQMNEDGLGIESVVKSLYEIHANLIVPEGKSKEDYVVTIWDADGKPLESHGSIVENYSTYGHNVDTVTVYVLDEETYMNECKGDNTGKQPEKALFSVTVDMGE